MDRRDIINSRDGGTDKKSGRVILHVDANSAYLSWEAVYRLQHGSGTDLREIPSVVGGDEASRHGIVLAKSIPTKKYGIQTGNSLFDARRKCPGLVIVPPRYDLYMQCSWAMLEILKEYSPAVQVFSIDECFLDFTDMEMLSEDPIRMAHVIRERIHRELGFTINIGISSNKLLAKMGGELKKPDMVHTLFPEEIPEKMWPLPVEELFMVGRATAPKLNRMGIYTIGELAATDPELLRYMMKSHGELIWNYANGREDSPVGQGGRIPEKGIGNSTTIAYDVVERREAHLVLLSLTETVGMRLRHGGFCTRLVSVSIRNARFESYSHQHKFSTPTDCTTAIFEKACALFDSMWKGEPIRHLGVRVTELCTNEFLQMSILERDWEKQKSLDSAMDRIRVKYGSGSVIRSSFLHSGLRPVTGGVIEDYQMMSSML